MTTRNVIFELTVEDVSRLDADEFESLWRYLGMVARKRAVATKAGGEKEILDG